MSGDIDLDASALTTREAMQIAHHRAVSLLMGLESGMIKMDQTDRESFALMLQMIGFALRNKEAGK